MKEHSYHVFCVMTGADESRVVLESVVLFDESDAISSTTGQAYTNGSIAWQSAPVQIPDGVSYQPPGAN